MSDNVFGVGEEGMMEDRMRMKRNSMIAETIKLTEEGVEVIDGVVIILDLETLAMTRLVVDHPRLLGIELLNVKP
jgi:hypothetical protein